MQNANAKCVRALLHFAFCILNFALPRVRSALALRAARFWYLPFRRRRVPYEVGRRRLDERGGEPRLPVVDAARKLPLDVVHELVDLALHLLDLAAHVQDDLDAGEIDAEIARQRQNRLQLFEVFLGVQPGITLGSRSEEHTSELQSLAYLVC